MPSSTIKFVCPKCLAEVRVVADTAGKKKRRCWRCKSVMEAAVDSDEPDLRSEQASDDGKPQGQQENQRDASADKPRKAFSFGPLNLGRSRKSKPATEQPPTGEVEKIVETNRDSIPDSEIELDFAEPDQDVVTRPKPVEAESPKLLELDSDELKLEAIPVQKPKTERVFDEEPAAPDELTSDSSEDELRLSDPLERPEYLTHHFAISEATDSAETPGEPDLLAPNAPVTTDSDRFAEKAHTEADKPDYEPLDLPKREVPQLAETYADEKIWFKEMLAFIPDAHLIAIWIGMTLLLTAQMVAMKWSIEFWSGDLVSRIIGFFMAATIAIPLTLIALVWGSVCGSNVFQQTAEGNKLMSDWPAFDFFGWINHSLYYIIPLLISLAPAFLIFQITGSSAAGGFITSIIAVAGMFFVFPLLMLSTVHNQSWWNPRAMPIWNSLSSCTIQWKRFFIRCAVLLLVAILFLLFTLVPSVVATSIAAGGMVFVALVYFRLLGFVARDVYNQFGIDEMVADGSGIKTGDDEGIKIVSDVMEKSSSDEAQ